MDSARFCWNNAWSAVVGFLVVGILLCFAAPSHAYADNSSDVGVKPWHEVELAAGESYDVSTASRNTTVHIKQPGSYTLSGSSTYVRVVVESGGVEIFCENGLSIDPGIYGYVGSSTASLIVGDQGGTVSIISKPGASVYFGGYLLAAAIEKEGWNTQLVFKTEDPGNPGTITAYRSAASGSPGIGTSYTLINSKSTGNIRFESGNIVATGGYCSAGIGGGNGGSCNGITIDGGTVQATGGASAAAIGGGLGGSGKNITINAGTVTALGDRANGVGIGGGDMQGMYGSISAENITINGGSVTAKGSNAGAAIGAGYETNARRITINGGTVTATCGAFACAIGGGGGNFYGTGSDIAINGGIVVAEATEGGTAIGSTKTGEGETSVVVTGGKVTAKSGAGGVAIGGGGWGSVVSSGNKTRVTISGGTVTAAAGSCDIGSKRNSDSVVAIIGGSVKADKVMGTPVNQAGAEVLKTTVLLQNAVENTGVAFANITDSSPVVSPSYGLNDVVTLDTDKLYFWLPATAAVSEAADLQGIVYIGSVAAGTVGELHRQTQITLDKNGGASDGSACARYQGTQMSDVVAPVAQAGYTLSGYFDTPHGGVLIADDSSAFAPNTAYSSAKGQWSHTSGSVTLFAQWKPINYTIAFDANVPNGASASVQGDTTSMTYDYGQAKPLVANGFSLQGYDFTGWNTQPDGSGDSYDDMAQVSNLASESGATVTLFAQWRAMAYWVYFSSGAGSGQVMAPQQFTVDSPQALSALTYSHDPEVFVGWDRGALGRLYADGEVVNNLCTYDASGAPQDVTLTAQWAERGSVVVCPVNNDVPISGRSTTIRLEGNGATFAGFTEDAGNPGYYSLNGIAAGTYRVLFDGYDTTGKEISVVPDAASVISLEYCDIDIASETHGTAAIVTDSGEVSSLAAVPVGKTLVLTTRTDTGYVFESYTGSLHLPIWEDNDPTIADQTIVVTGEAHLEAHPAPVRYAVTFNANAADASGAMTTQDLVYDEPQNLFANSFTRVGYTFAGWTTTPAWTGTQYFDGESVQNLASSDGATLVLYAQWRAQSYYVEFNGNGGNTGLMLNQKHFYDMPQALEPNDCSMPNYHFIGWNTEADGSGASYADEQEVVNLSVKADNTVTLWAQWEHDSYRIDFDANGGSGAMDSQELWHGEWEWLSACTYTQANARFIGWNTARDGSGVFFADRAQVQDLAASGESVTLFAQWESDSRPVPEGGGEEANKQTPTSTPQVLAATSDGVLFPSFVALAIAAFGVVIVGRLRYHRYKD